jgi:hypothetical protein
MTFRLVLWSVGVLLAVVSRISPRLRAQLARDMTVCIGSRDGVARSYVFRNRRVSSHVVLTPDAHCLVMFQTAAEGARIFLAPDCIALLVDGLGSRKIELRGDPTSVLWFYEMVMAYVPGRVQRSHVMPDAYIAPNLNGKVANRITREPAVEALDTAWTEASAQRDKIILWQVGRGAPVYGKSKNYKPVIDIDVDVASSEMGLERTNE